MRLSKSVARLDVCALAISLTAVLPACRPPTAEQIVARTAEAMAGERGMENLKTLRIRMVYPDHELPVVTEVSRPNRMRSEGGHGSVIVFDGARAAFLKRPPAADGTPQGPALIEAAYLRDLELDIAFVFPAFFDHPPEYLGRETIDGIETHKLGVTLPMGVRTTYFIDAERYLPVKLVADVTIDGTEYHPGRIFQDYANQGGMRYPRAVRYWWMPDSVETAVVERVEINPPLSTDRFVIPADIVQ